MSVQPGIQPAAFVQTGRALPFTLPVTALTRVVKNIPGGALVGGVGIQNFSHLWVYIGIGSGSVQKGGAGLVLVIPPYQSGSTPVVADNVNILVDTGVDGSSATTQPNEFIQGVVQEAPLPFTLAPMAGVLIPTVVKSFITQASPVVIWTPAAGKKFRLSGGHLSASVAGTYQLADGGVGGTVFATIQLPTNTSVPFLITPQGFLSALANNTLAIVTGAANVSGYVCGTEE